MYIYVTMHQTTYSCTTLYNDNKCYWLLFVKLLLIIKYPLFVFRFEIMDSQASDYVSYAHPNQRCHVSTASISHIDVNSTTCNDYVFDVNDHTTLISNCTLKKKKYKCQCSLLSTNNSKSNGQNALPWITFIHILCTVRKYYNKNTKLFANLIKVTISLVF